MTIPQPPTARRTTTATLPLSLRLDTPSRARAWIRSTLRRWGLNDLTDTVELLTSELIANAIRHTGRPLHVCLRHGEAPHGTALTVEVADGDPRPPRRSGAVTPDDESGRGMNMVALLTDRNGTTRTREGKTVWFQLSAPATPR